MKSRTALTDDAREQVRRIVFRTRLGGLAIAAALAALSFYVHWGSLGTSESVAQLITVVAGLASFIILSTVSRMGHARILEKSLNDVQDLSAQLRQIAERDPLTGLYNLRAFQAHLEAELEKARPNRAPVSLIVADLDNFKLLNDAFGHQFGDQVLRETGRVFAACEAEAARAARLGGDEFALVLPGATRAEAVGVARSVEAMLRESRIDDQHPATLGSFGIGTFPEDGANVQALFASADSRMYSEKHRRKAESLSSLAGAARKLFVRVGQAMRPDHSTPEILQEIAVAAREEFALTLCAIFMSERVHHAPLVVASAVDSGLEAAAVAAGVRGTAAATSVGELLPGENWLIETPLHDDILGQGVILLAGTPMSSFRPDAAIALALADLVQAVVANGRAHSEAARAGRERDIHIDLARALAGEGALDQRLSHVAEMINSFIGASFVSIEGIPRDRGTAPYNIASGARERFLEKWQSARLSEGGVRLLIELANGDAAILEEPAHDVRVPETERALLLRAGIRSSAVCPVRFDGEALGILGAVSTIPGYFTEELLRVLQSIADHLAPAINGAFLRENLEASYAHLERASRESLARLADAAEARDPHTAGHLRRICGYSIELARELGVPDDDAEAIGNGSAVHDLGKLGLPDSVLMNPGKLSEAEWAQMRRHPEDGERLIGDSPMFSVERAVARWHHERWDGSGYPDGLTGDDIPLCARIVAVADAFDALTTERPYKRAWTIEEAMAEVMLVRATLFCPTVVDALQRLFERGRLADVQAEAQRGEEAHEHRPLAA